MSNEFLLELAGWLKATSDAAWSVYTVFAVVVVVGFAAVVVAEVWNAVNR